MARQTSINCYYEHVSKFMNKQEARVYNALIELKEATRGEIAEHLKMEIEPHYCSVIIER